MYKYFDNLIRTLLDVSKSIDENAVLRESKSYIPKYLYKYRPCDKKAFDMLEQEYLWFDMPSTYTDPFDSRVQIGLRYELPQIQEWFEKHIGELVYYRLEPKGMMQNKGKHKLIDYINLQESSIDKNGKFNAKLANKKLALEIKKLSPEGKHQYKKALAYYESEEFKVDCNNIIEKVISGIQDFFRNSKIMVCLTKRNDNSKMWEEYANKFSGFCIEYKIRIDDMKSKECKRLLLNMFPVKYYKRIPRIKLLPFIIRDYQKTFYSREYDIKEEVVKLYKQMLCKRNEYACEEEWRIILNETKARKVDFPYISAVYAGMRISEKNLKRLKAICRRKNIRLYKQRLDRMSNKYVFDELDVKFDKKC